MDIANFAGAVSQLSLGEYFIKLIFLDFQKN